MLTVQFDDTKLRDPKDLKSLNFFHFRKLIAVPGMNDLMFRRRLFSTCWASRKKALSAVKTFLTAGKQFSVSQLPSDLSVMRDQTLLFGTKKEAADLFNDEANYLPQNQAHNYHDLYAQIIHMIRAKSYQNSEDSDLMDLYAHLERNTPVVTDKWTRFWLEDEDENTCGPVFYAPSGQAANELCFLVNESHTLDQITGKDVGLCALGFTLDPILLTQKCKEQELQLLREIKQISKDANSAKQALPQNHTEPTDTDDPDFLTQENDFE